MRCLMSFTFALFSLFVHADEPSPKTLDELKAAIEKIRVETHVPAIGIAIVDKSGPLWVAGLGLADKDKKIPADADTLFRIASVSKMFVALSILQLQEAGKLSLNDKVHDWVPDVEFNNPWEATNPIRIAHLLEHTTGWDEWHAVEEDFSAPDTMGLKQALAYHPDSRTSRWVPGTRLAYCNSGSAVAAYIVEKITGQRYEDYVAEHFFAPLNMSSTSYFQTSLYQQKSATLYTDTWYVPYRPVKAEPYRHLLYRPAGAINSSPRDMANFIQLMLQRGSFNSRNLVATTSIDRMETPTTSLGAAKGITAGYGLANYVSGFKQAAVVFHGHSGGLKNNARAEFRYSRELGVGYIFMMNDGDGAALDRISDAIRAYLSRNQPSTANPIPHIDLPSSFKDIDGYYILINPRQQSAQIYYDIFGLLRVRVDKNAVHIKTLLGGKDSTTFYAVNDQVLAEPGLGLPGFAKVHDPLAGDALQISGELGGDLYKRISLLRVVAQFAVMVATPLFSLLVILMWPVWALHRRMKKIPRDASVWLRWSELLPSIMLLLYLMLIALSQLLDLRLGIISPFTLAIFVISILYPVSVIAGAFGNLKYRTAVSSSWLRWQISISLISHVLFVLFLAHYGFIGLRTWA